MGQRKKKSHKIYAFFVLTLGILILVLAMLLLFHIQQIEVEGNDYCTDKEIAELAGTDRFSTNSLYVLAKFAFGRGDTLPCLDSIKVSLKAPWSLKIKVEEKPIVGYLYDDTEYVYFDKEGLVVDKSTVPVEGVPCVEGLEVSEMEEYKLLETEASQIFEEILETSQELKKQDLTAKKIVCDQDRIYLYIEQICVSLGNSVDSAKIAQISPILKELDGQEGTLHLESYSEDQGMITFDVGKIS